MNPLEFPNAYEGDCLPTGEYVVGERTFQETS